MIAARLLPEEVAGVWAEGRVMSLDEFVELALAP